MSGPPPSSLASLPAPSKKPNSGTVTPSSQSSSSSSSSSISFPPVATNSSAPSPSSPSSTRAPSSLASTTEINALAAQLDSLKGAVDQLLKDKIRTGVARMDALTASPALADNKSAPVGLVSRAAESLDNIKQSSRPHPTPAAKRKSKQVSIDVSDDDFERTEHSESDDEEADNKSGSDAVDKDAALEDQLVSRLRAHAVLFRNKYGSLEQCYELKEDDFKSSHVWRGAMFAALIADKLMEKIPRAEILDICLRRIAALELANTTGDWQAADTLQAGTRSATLLHTADMRRCVQQSKQLRGTNKTSLSKSRSSNSKSSRSSNKESDKLEGKSRPSGRYFNRRFKNRKGGSRSSSRGRSSSAPRSPRRNNNNNYGKDGAAKSRASPSGGAQAK